MNKLKQFITKYNKLLMEVLYVSIVILACSLISICSLFYKTPDEIKTALSYKYNFYLLAESFIYGAVLISASSFAFYYLHPGEETTPAKMKVKNIIIYGILMFLGLCAYIVIAQILYVYLNFGKGSTFFFSTAITLIYVYLMFKLYYFDRVDSKKIIWELIRFGLVGVIAALFDFSTVSLMRFGILKNLTNSTAVTLIAVTCGFIAGVIVNYICSVFMVYKEGVNNSKTIKGVVLFVGLSAVGLLIGIGLEALFFDLLKLPYPAVFIIRTLIVLIWNYITRKLFIFKTDKKIVEKQ